MPSFLLSAFNLFLCLMFLLLLANNSVFLPVMEGLPRLPASESAKIAGVDKHRIIMVTRDQYVFNSVRAKTFKELESAVVDAFRETEGDNRVLTVRADKELPYERLIEIFTSAQKNDIRVYLATEPAPQAQPMKVEMP